MIAWLWGVTGAGIGGTAWHIARRGRRRVLAFGSGVLVVGAACGTLFGALAARGVPLLLLITLSWFTVVAVVLAGLDLTTRRLPNRLLLAGYAGVGAGLAVETAALDELAPLLRALAVAVVASAFFAALYVAAAGQLGGGDVKLVGLLGLMLGWSGWGMAAAGLWLGVMGAAVWTFGARLLRRRPRDVPLPLGTFLLGATLLVLLITAAPG